MVNAFLGLLLLEREPLAAANRDPAKVGKVKVAASGGQVGDGTDRGRRHFIDTLGRRDGLGAGGKLMQNKREGPLAFEGRNI